MPVKMDQSVLKLAQQDSDYLKCGKRHWRQRGDLLSVRYVLRAIQPLTVTFSSVVSVAEKPYGVVLSHERVNPIFLGFTESYMCHKVLEQLPIPMRPQCGSLQATLAL